MRHAGPLPTHPDEDDLVALADAVRERDAGLPHGRLTGAPVNGFSNSAVRNGGATAASGGLLAPPEPSSGHPVRRGRGHLRVLPDPAD